MKDINHNERRYFKAELNKLRELGPFFAKQNPQLASGLEKLSIDPDVERLLEGTAYLTADIQKKLDDQYPQFLHQIASSIAPEALHPMPASTLIQFHSKKGNDSLIKVSKGTTVASESSGSKDYLFSTCFPLDVWPVEILNVDRGHSDDEDEVPDGLKIRVELKTFDVPLASLNMNKLRFYIGGDYAGASDLFFILNQHLNSIVIKTKNGQETTLKPNALSPAGLEDNESLLEKEGHDLSVFNHIHDFFHLPEKFLFFDLDISEWINREGDSFEINFILDVTPIAVPELSKSRFALHVTPAINLYQKEAELLILDHLQSDYAIKIKDAHKDAHIFSVNSVQGILQSVKKERKYYDFTESIQTGRGNAIYHIKREPSKLTGKNELFFVPTYKKSAKPEKGEVVKIKLMVTDGVSVQSLLPGQITQHTMQTPQRLTFTNLIVPKGSRAAPLNEDLLWHLVSHAMLQKTSMSSAESVRQYLGHYALLSSMTNAGANVAQRKIDGLMSIQVKPSDRLYKNQLYRGHDISASIRKDYYVSEGDRYLFASVINRLFQAIAPMNYYSAFIMRDTEQEESIEWPMSLGKQVLI